MSDETRRLLREMTQEAVEAGTYGYPAPSNEHLARHLASKHADVLALTRTLAENQAAHTHEHDGPGTIRNHDREDLSWDDQSLDRVIAEMVESHPDFSCPEMVLSDPYAPLAHVGIAYINLRVRDLGEQWAKCSNCGNPYQMTEDWDSSSICSDSCSEAYIAYLNNPEL